MEQNNRLECFPEMGFPNMSVPFLSPIGRGEKRGTRKDTKQGGSSFWGVGSHLRCEHSHGASKARNESALHV